MSTSVDAATSKPGKLSRWSWLDPAPDASRWTAWETGAILLWFAVAAFAVAQHVPWADEEQAWFLAGGVGWRELFFHSLHYEGEGGLWHLSLKLLQLAQVSFTAMRWIAMAAQGAAMAVLLRWAPFPRVVRLALPFMFFLLYQDGVIARSYCLFALLAFPAAVMLRGARPRPVTLALVLGLLAMVSVHGVLLSAGLALVALHQWRGVPARRGIAALCLLGAFWLVATSVASPATDIDFTAGNNLHRSFVRVERSLGLHPAPPPPSILTMPMAGRKPAPIPPHVRHGFGKQEFRAARIVAVLTYPLSSSRVLALLFAAFLVAQAFAFSRRSAPAMPGGLGPIALLPAGVMVLVFLSLYLQPRHCGTLLTGFLVTAWLTWPARGSKGRRWISRVTAALLLLVAANQIFWTAKAINHERHLPYSPGRMTAMFLQSQGVAATGASRPVAAYYYYSITPLLYFNRNIYFNQPAHRYWYWSTALRTYSTADAVLAKRPAIILVSGVENGPDAAITRDWEGPPPPVPGVVLGDAYGFARFFEQHGYVETHRFCGHRWMRATWAEAQCDMILQRVDREH